MQATLAEFGATPGQPYLKALWSQIPADSRFAKCEYQPVPPQTHIDHSTRTIIFNLLPKDPPHLYLLDNMLIYCTTVITKKSKTDLPEPTAVVAPVCNGPASLFANLRMSINGKEITTNQTGYPYKCYLQNLLSYPETAKDTNLFLSGWQNDSAWANTNGEMTTHASMSNQGLIKRNSWYRDEFESFTATNVPKYRTTGFKFLAPFRHELNGVNKPLPPGTKVQFVLERADPEFSLMRVDKSSESQAANDTEEYQINITMCELYVKVAQMNLPLYREMASKFESEPISYYHRKLFCTMTSFNFDSHAFETNNLFPDGLQPIKVFFAFVETPSVRGDYKLNPFCFQRCWVPKKANSTNFDASTYHDLLGENQLRAQIRHMQEEQALRDAKRDREQQKMFKMQALMFKQMRLSSKLFKKHSKGKGKSVLGKKLAKSSAPKDDQIPLIQQTDGNDDDDDEYEPDPKELDASSSSDSEDLNWQLEHEDSTDGDNDELFESCSANQSVKSEGSRNQPCFSGNLKPLKKPSLVSKMKACFTPSVTVQEDERLPLPRERTPEQNLRVDPSKVAYVVSFELEIDSHRVDQAQYYKTLK